MIIQPEIQLAPSHMSSDGQSDSIKKMMAGSRRLSVSSFRVLRGLLRGLVCPAVRRRFGSDLARAIKIDTEKSNDAATTKVLMSLTPLHFAERFCRVPVSVLFSRTANKRRQR